MEVVNVPRQSGPLGAKRHPPGEVHSLQRDEGCRRGKRKLRPQLAGRHGVQHGHNAPSCAQQSPCVQGFAANQKPPSQGGHRRSPDGRERITRGRHKGPNYRHSEHTSPAQQSLLPLHQQKKHQRNQGNVVPTDCQQVRQPQLTQGKLDFGGHRFLVAGKHAQHEA